MQDVKMQKVAKNKTKHLPRWINYIPHTKQQRDEREEDVEDIKNESLPSREDCYLREKAFHCLSRLIDSAIEAAFDESLMNEDNLSNNDRGSYGSGVLNELTDFLSQFQPTGNELLLSDNDLVEESDSPAKKICQEDKSSENIFLLQSWIKSRQYHPTILPLVILHCTPSVLDRRELVQSLQRGLMCTIHKDPDANAGGSKKRRRRRRQGIVDFKPAICTIRNHENSGKGRKRSRDLSDYLNDILTQCINQEKDPSQYKYLVDKRCCSLKSSAAPHLDSRSTPMPYKDRLLRWCLLTKCYNSIVVIVENPEIMPILSIDSFIGIISSLRSHSGVPISLVFVSVSEDLQKSRLSLLSNHSIDGQAGVQVRDFHTNSSSSMIDDLIKKLYSNIDGQFFLPVTISPQVLKKMRASFHDNHGSVVTFIREMKMVLAHHFSTEGSFLAMVQNKSFIEQYGRQVAWFCVTQSPREQRIKRALTKSKSNVSSKAVFKTIQAAVEGRSLLSLVGKLVNTARLEISNLRMKESSGEDKKSFDACNDADPCITMSAEYKNVLEVIFIFFRSAALSDLLTILLQWIAEVDGHLDICTRVDISAVLCDHLGADYIKNNDLTDTFGGIERLKQFLNESIVLVGALIETQFNDKHVGKIESVEKDFRESLVVKFEVILGEIPFSGCAVFGRNHEPDLNDFFDSLHAEPRRFIASSIASPILIEDCVRKHAADVQTAFKCFDTRIISKDDWFQLFVTHTEGFGMKLTSNELLQQFAFAVYELVLCGLVSRAVGRTDSFEKRAMVWAA